MKNSKAVSKKPTQAQTAIGQGKREPRLGHDITPVFDREGAPITDHLLQFV
jgi:hypothetical protein